MSDESLFREVDEEVRQEQFKKLWARYGNLIIAVCLIIVAGVAGWKGWQYWQAKQSEAAGEVFFAAAKLAGTGKADEALKQFEGLSHAGYAALAELRKANLLAAQGKPQEAVKIYDALAQSTTADSALRDLAKIRAAALVADQAALADLEARLKPFDSAGNPWRHTARELLAVSQWKAGNITEADRLVQAILADTETPAGVRQRAQDLADLLAPQLETK